MFLRSLSRRFCSESSVSGGGMRPMLFKVSGVVLAAGAGSLLYDTLSRMNMKKISESVQYEQIWDEDWDRYVRVPPELQQDIKEWFIAPDNEIVREREQYDEEHDIGIREVIMVRHGQYAENGDLSVLGRAQAEATATRLAKLLKGKQVRCIYHSDMPRAKQTAEAVAKLFPDVRLVESHLLTEAIPAEPNPPAPNCPPFVQSEAERLEKGFRSFFARPMGESPNESVDILIGHGNCFRFFVCRALQIDPSFWLRMAINNCGISCVQMDANGTVSLRGLGDVGHLEPQQVTYN